MRVSIDFIAKVFALSEIVDFSVDFLIISFISMPFLSCTSSSISNSNSVAFNEFFLLLQNLSFLF